MMHKHFGLLENLYHTYLNWDLQFKVDLINGSIVNYKSIKIKFKENDMTETFFML